LLAKQPKEYVTYPNIAFACSFLWQPATMASCCPEFTPKEWE
jgi:hypothetical protein